MLKKQFLGFFGSSEPKFKFSFEELRNHYDVLHRNPVINDNNKAQVVETIRSISEFIIWGDQNEVKVFEFFLENNIMIYLHNILLQRSNRSGDIAKQVLQTLSIIIQNVKSETGIFFLFSNNHINNILEVEFDFDDEEVLGYYVSFLKTISLKLNPRTVQFFFDNKNGQITFPLYINATRFAHHKEGMVRAAVRTLTLSIYCVEDPFVQTFIINPPATNFLHEVSLYLVDQIKLLDKKLLAAEYGGSQAMAALDSQLAEAEDIISYLSDVLSIGSQEFAHLLAQEIWQTAVVPLLLMPLLELGSQQGANASSGSSSGSTGGKVRTRCALFILERLVVMCGYKPLLHQLLLALLAAQLPPQQASSSRATGAHSAGSSNTAIPEIPNPAATAAAAAAAAAGGDSSGTHAASPSDTAQARQQSARQHRALTAPYTKPLRHVLIELLRGENAVLAYHVLRLLTAIQQCRAAAPELLFLLGLASKSKAAEVETRCIAGRCAVCRLQQQLDTFTVASTSSSFMTGITEPACRDALLWVHCYMGLPGGERKTPAGHAMHESEPVAPASESQGLEGTEDLATDTDSHVEGRSSVSTPVPAGRSSSSTPAPQRRWQDGEDDATDAGTDVTDAMQELQLGSGSPGSPEVPPSQCYAHSYSSSAGRDVRVVDALFHLLSLQMFPAGGMRLLAWQMHQLLPQGMQAVASAGALAGPQAGEPGSSSPGPGEQSAAAGDAAAGTTADAAAAGRPGTPPIPAAAGSRSASPGPSGSTAPMPASIPATMLPTAHLTTMLPSSVLPHMDATGALPQHLHTSQPVLQPAPHLQLSPQQHHQLQTALSAAQTALLEELSSMWCEAVFPIMSNEWPTAREATLRPVLRASSDALLSGPSLYPLCKPRPVNGSQREVTLSTSAQAALKTLYAVQRAVALLQMKELLTTSTIPRTAPLPAVSEADLKRADTQEGCQVDLIPGSAIPCVVSFAPGQERRVFFAVAGLSTRRLTGTDAGQDRAQAHSALLHSLPVAVLADPAPSKLNAGVVLSVAPLLGSDPSVDKSVGKWLHVHVRPSVRGLLRVLKTAVVKKGLMSAMRQLSDGHWVLAFPDAERSSNARMLVHQHSAKLRALYCEVLEPVMAVRMSVQQGQEQEGQQGQGQEGQQQEEEEEEEGQQGGQPGAEGGADALYQLL